MWQIIVPIAISLLLLTTNIVSVIYNIRLKRKEHLHTIENTINTDTNITIFTTRESMLSYLHSMYDRAENGDILWGQSVSGHIYGDVNGKIIDAASRGVKFQMIFNQNTISINRVIDVFRAIKGTTIVLRSDNDVRIQGISEKEAVIAISTDKKYSAIVIRDRAIVRVLRAWFEERLTSSGS